jgi:hypothetical protein
MSADVPERSDGMSRRASRRRRRSGTHQLSGVDQRLRFNLSPFRAPHSRNASGHRPHRDKARHLKAARLTTSPRAFRRRFVRRRRVRDLQTVHHHPVQNAPRSHSAAKLIHVQITLDDCRRAAARKPVSDSDPAPERRHVRPARAVTSVCSAFLDASCHRRPRSL